jgi:hypothetical protein
MAFCSDHFSTGKDVLEDVAVGFVFEHISW